MFPPFSFSPLSFCPQNIATKFFDSFFTAVMCDLLHRTHQSVSINDCDIFFTGLWVNQRHNHYIPVVCLIFISSNYCLLQLLFYRQLSSFLATSFLSWTHLFYSGLILISPHLFFNITIFLSLPSGGLFVPEEDRVEVRSVHCILTASLAKLTHAHLSLS